MKQLETKSLFSGKSVGVSEKRYRRADGSEVKRLVVEHPGAVAIAAHDGEFAYLVRQPREAVEDDGLLEVPAGTMDVAGESEQECAERELSEEVGLAAKHWTRLHAIYPSPGFLNERVTIFAATGLSPRPGEADEDEQIEVVRLPLLEIEGTLPRIEDAKSLIALMLLLRHLELNAASRRFLQLGS